MNTKIYAGKTEAEIVSRNSKNENFMMALDFAGRASGKHNAIAREMFAEIASKTRSASLKAFCEAHA